MKPPDLFLFFLLGLAVGWYVWPVPEEIDEPVTVGLSDSGATHETLRVDGSRELRTNNATGELWTTSRSGDQTVSMWCHRENLEAMATTCIVKQDGSIAFETEEPKP